MSNTFKKTGLRGFTLIELLVVIAIIGLLSTIIAAPIQNARKKARDAKKIAELKSLQLAIEQFAESNDGNYPATFAELSPGYMPLLPTFTSSTTSTTRDTYSYVTYVASSTGSDSQRFAFHIGSKLEIYGPALDTDRDCISGELTSSLNDPFCVVYNGDFIVAEYLQNGFYAQLASTTLPGGAGVTSGSDFWGGNPLPADSTPKGRDESATSTCKNINDCIFDITSQQ